MMQYKPKQMYSADSMPLDGAVQTPDSQVLAAKGDQNTKNTNYLLLTALLILAGCGDDPHSYTTAFDADGETLGFTQDGKHGKLAISKYGRDQEFFFDTKLVGDLDNIVPGNLSLTRYDNDPGWFTTEVTYDDKESNKVHKARITAKEAELQKKWPDVKKKMARHFTK